MRYAVIALAAALSLAVLGTGQRSLSRRACPTRTGSSTDGRSCRTAARWARSARSRSIPMAATSGPSSGASARGAGALRRRVPRLESRSDLKFGPDGRVVKSFGGGMFIWPHGLAVDKDGSVWVTDAVASNRIPAGDKRGHMSSSSTRTGKWRRRLGRPARREAAPTSSRRRATWWSPRTATSSSLMATAKPATTAS